MTCQISRENIPPIRTKKERRRSLRQKDSQVTPVSGPLTSILEKEKSMDLRVFLALAEAKACVLSLALTVSLVEMSR